MHTTRRRATSYHRRIKVQRRPNLRLAAALGRPVPHGTALKRRRLNTNQATSAAAPLQARPTNRKMRRRPELLLRQAVEQRCPSLELPPPPALAPPQPPPLEEQEPPPAQGGAPSAPRRLATHAWHARRMRMHAPLWGHALPVQAAGKGHGSRALLHHLRAQCVAHDTSYHGCLQLSGRQRHVAHLLRTCW